MKKSNNKIMLFLGLLCIFSAFLCVVTVFYQVVQGWQDSSRQLRSLRTKLTQSEAGQQEARREAQELARRVGRGIEFDTLIAASARRHGIKEQGRRTGDLWIDRESGQWMVTLGALNHLAEGGLLRVMDGTRVVGMVSARTVLDVVSYVVPLDDPQKFVEDIYQVVMEK